MTAAALPWVDYLLEIAAKLISGCSGYKHHILQCEGLLG
jgi:hypothetical protein